MVAEILDGVCRFDEKAVSNFLNVHRFALNGTPGPVHHIFTSSIPMGNRFAVPRGCTGGATSASDLLCSRRICTGLYRAFSVIFILVLSLFIVSS